VPAQRTQATSVLHLAETHENGGLPAADGGKDLSDTLHLGLVTAVSPVARAFGGVVQVAFEGVVAVVEKVLHVVRDDTERVGGAAKHGTPPEQHTPYKTLTDSP